MPEATQCELSEACRGPGGHCPFETSPPMCVIGMQDSFICADGSQVPVNTVCDREVDCADASDEASCLR